jgi:hypothetical protein
VIKPKRSGAIFWRDQTNGSFRYLTLAEPENASMQAQPGPKPVIEDPTAAVGFFEGYPGLLKIPAKSVGMLEQMIMVHATNSSDVEVTVEFDTSRIEVQGTVAGQIDFYEATSDYEADEPVRKVCSLVVGTAAIQGLLRKSVADDLDIATKLKTRTLWVSILAEEPGLVDLGGPV